MPAPRKKSPLPMADMPSWIAHWRPIYTFHNALMNFIDIDCFVVPLEQPTWMALHRARRTMALADLAYWVATPEQRWENYTRGLARIKKTGRSAMTRLGGFCDLFIPVLQKDRPIAAVVAGPFLDHEVSPAEFRQSWIAAGGSHDAAFSDDFSYFCRVLLDTPVIEGPALKALRSLSELFAGALGGEQDPSALNAKMEQIFYSVICRNFYHQTWSDRVVRQHRYFMSSWRAGRVTEWEGKELGISHVPQRLIACAPAVEPLKSPLEIRIQSTRFQRAALGFAAGRGDVAVGRLADYGVLLFHAPAPKAAPEDRGALLLVREFQDYIRKNCGFPAFAGVGPRENKEHLYRSYLGALEALHQGVDQRRSVTQPGSKDVAAPSQVSLAEAESALVQATLGGRKDKIENARGNFVALAHRLSGERLDALRVHFQRFGQALVDAALRQGRMEEAVGGEVGQRWFMGLEKASNASEMVHALRAELDRSGDILEQPSSGMKNLRFARAKKWVEENFQRDPSLKEVAAAHGFSPSSFARELKRASGSSFSRWIGDLRLRHVQELLDNTRLSASAIAASAGFDSLSYFFQWYKKQTGSSPGAWRQGRQKSP